MMIENIVEILDFSLELANPSMILLRCSNASHMITSSHSMLKAAFSRASGTEYAEQVFRKQTGWFDYP